MAAEQKIQGTENRPADRIAAAYRNKPETARILLDAARADGTDLLKKFGASADGFSEESAAAIREQTGPNEIAAEKPLPLVLRVLKAFVDPFSLVLIALAFVSMVTDVILQPAGEKDWSTSILILVLVLLSTLLKFFQEERSEQAAKDLKEMVHTTAAVRRGPEGVKEIPLAEIVPGDIVCLSGGDIIPADLRVLQCKDLFVAQGSLTGESAPVEKTSAAQTADGADPLTMQDLVFMGCTVVSGSAVCLVLLTGDRTCFGGLARSVIGKRARTSFDKGVQSVSSLLMKFMAVMVPIVFVVNGFTKGDWFQAFLFAVSVAVGLTPEMLPMIVTTNLARGAVQMSKKKTIVKHLDSMQNFGAMDILCTDKTGTITQDKVVLEKYLDFNGAESERVLKHAFLNSYFETGLKNLMDLAVMEHITGENCRVLTEKYTKVDEIPFDFERRRMSVVLRDRDGKTQLITKGAMEELLSISSYAEIGGKAVPLTGEIRSGILGMTRSLNGEGMRVLGVAQKTNPPTVGAFSVKDESEMVLIGCLAFLDPPKESAAGAIRSLAACGVSVKVLTGDNDDVARYICRHVGIPDELLYLGSDVEKMSDEELRSAAEKASIFAKLSPQQKARVIGALRADGHVVGYMGDGINDAPAMRQADVAVSVDTAADIAKETADIILLEKDLNVLQNGVIEGRRTFGNIMKYIKMTASSSFGNMFSVMAASAFLPFLPMMPVQILLLDLINDFSCISFPWDNIDREYLAQPHKWDASTIGRFMLCLGPVSSVFDIATYLLLFFVICPAAFGMNYAAMQDGTAFATMFHTGWFVESLWSQTMIMHVLRTPKMSPLQSHASGMVFAFTSISIAAGTILPYSFLARELSMSALPVMYYPFLAVVIVCYLASAALMKRGYIRRFGDWL